METILEEKQRFSHSLLWRLQENAYNAFGPRAWSEKGVPFYLTSNPFTAERLAAVAIGYLRDCLRLGLLDTKEPFYLFDLGAGTGRLGWLFLKSFLPVAQKLFPGPIRYVMTDIVKENIEFWKQHSYLQDLIQAGNLDFAYYRHDQEDPLLLEIAGTTLQKLKNPCAIIGSYFFDTIPQDLFKGELEGRITLSVEGTVTSIHDPELIPKLSCRYDYLPMQKESYYQNEVEAFRKEYAKEFHNTAYLFPIGAFQSINYFSRLCDKKMLVLGADQGVCTADQVRAWGEPRLDKHGTFSISVSYYAIASYLRYLGGTGLLTSFPDPQFAVITGVLGGTKEQYWETSIAFQDCLDQFEPKDYWFFVGDLYKNWQDPPLQDILLLIKFGSWDPMNFHAFFERIRILLPKATKSEKEELSNVMEKVWEQFYPICVEEGAFVMNLGVIAFEIGNYAQALHFFQLAAEIGGSNAALEANIRACKTKLEERV